LINFFLELLYAQKFDKTIVEFLHPDTYLNKIVVGFADGDIGIFNIKNGKLIHTFTDFSGQRLTALIGSPDPDIVVVGFASGTVSFFEIKKGQVLFSLKVEGAPTAMSFRTDELAHFAVGSARGEVYIFDLDSRKLEHIMPIHAKTVTSLWFVPQQPLLVTAAGDNSLKEFLFESCEYRCLRYRSGHYKPPVELHFLGEDARFLLSAGADKSLRFFSILKDNQNFEFSQGSTQKIAAKLKVAEDEVKLPPISSFDVFETKTLKWDNMVTSHQGQSHAKTWRLDRKTIGEHTLQTSDKSVITHVSMSACGNFALLSTISGLVEIFNVQSGLKRRSVIVTAGVKILAAYTDATASNLLAICEDGSIKQYSMLNGQKSGGLDLSIGKITAVAINRDTEFLAVAGTEVIQVVDHSAMNVVRVFTGHTGSVTSMTFSSDSKWLISAARDCTIRTWDLPSGNLVDSLAVKSVPVAVELSRNLEFLASAHESEIHISMWSNRSLYTGDCNMIESAISWSSTSTSISNEASSEVALSSFPASRWKNIYFLEKIKSNTKPIAMSSSNKRPALPFFLTQALEQEKTLLQDEMGAEVETVSSEEFAKKLSDLMSSHSYLEFFEFISLLHPSKIEFEISSLPREGERKDCLVFMLVALTEAANRGKAFELCQAILAVILRHHERFFAEESETFKPVLQTLKQAIQQKWEPLETLLQKSICLTSYAREH
jgi:U3 small nucleolar RNA-associated protein 21